MSENNREQDENSNSSTSGGGIMGSTMNFLGGLTSTSGSNSTDNTSKTENSGGPSILQKLTGANKGTSNHYKNATDFDDKDQSSTHDKGNVIHPNDNQNVKYSSMVDSVVSDDDVSNGELRSSGQIKDDRKKAEEEKNESSDTGKSDEVQHVPGL